MAWVYGDNTDGLGAPSQRFAIMPTGTIVSVRPVTPTRRMPPALFGLGYLEAIPTDDLRSRSDPLDADRDGISGRVPWRDECFGRFGWQSTVCDIASFVIGALSREIGIDMLPKSRREISESDAHDLVAYVRGLPPPPAPVSNEGEALFERVLCSRCHTPVTGIASLAGQTIEVRADTDLLMHELGGGPRHQLRDSRTEFRTPALWGLASAGPPFLHDGSAATYEEAILRHRGEGERARQLFTSLTRTERHQLLHFVGTR